MSVIFINGLLFVGNWVPTTLLIHSRHKGVTLMIYAATALL